MSTISPKTHLFLKACLDGDFDALKALSEDPEVDVNAEVETPGFYVACAEGDLDAVRLLLVNRRVNVNQPEANRFTPLVGAVYHSRISVVKELLGSPRIDLNTPGKKGKTPLFYASVRDPPEILHLLLAAPGIDVNQPNDKGKTVLFRALKRLNVEAVKALIKDPRVDVNRASRRCQTPAYALVAGERRSHGTDRLLCAKWLLSSPRVVDVTTAGEEGGEYTHEITPVEIATRMKYHDVAVLYERYQQSPATVSEELRDELW